MAYEQIKRKSETGRCLLCQDAPCSSCCPKGLAVADIVRSLRFENIKGAARKLGESNPCEGCSAPCVDACTRSRIDRGIDIPMLFSGIAENVPQENKADLSIDFCGVHCENPFFLSSSVVGSNYEMVAKAFDLGWAGVAFKTIGLFVPDEVSPRFAALEKEDNPFVGFKNIEQISDHTLEENLGYLRKLKENYPTKVIIASIMGQNETEWTKLASLMEEAGADIIECNFSCPQMVGEGLGSDVGTNPELVARYTAATRRGTKLPILAKMTPNITRMEIPAHAAIQAGAEGLAAINTIKSVMNIDLESFASAPDVDGKSAVGGYSGKAVKPIALRFIHDLKKDARLRNVPVSGMGGIETWRDAAEFMALGCETVQVTTSVMQYGYRIIEDMIEGMSDYLTSIGAHSIREIVGKALPNVVPAEEVNRHSIEYPRFNRSSCVGCGRCYLSCFDGGHQALRMDENRQPVMDPKKCVGCQLCKLVCPTGSITAGTRVDKKIS